MGEGLDERGRRAALNRAVELQAERDRLAEDAAATAALREAAREAGVAPEVFDRAAVEVAEHAKRTAREATHARRRVALGVGGLGLVLVGVALGARLLVGPPATAPFTFGFEGPAGLGLDTSPGSRATLRFPEEAGRGPVAVIEVAEVRPSASGVWHVNLDSTHVPQTVGDYERVAFDVKGTLPSVRIYLEVGGDERWRSPPIAVGPDWTRREVALSAFEHQRLEDGKWRVVGGGPPERIDAVSFKLGHYVNPPEATGSVWLDDLTWR